MASKKLKDLAKIGLGLAAAYGASKVLGNKTPGGSDTAFGIDASMDTSSRSSGPVDIRTAEEKGLEITRSKPFGMSDEATIATSKTIPTQTARYNSGISKAAGYAIPEPSMATDRDTRVAARIARLRGAKTGKMMKASKGGSVVARGNKIARSKPTKLF
jgi:hypothetical protein